MLKFSVLMSIYCKEKPEYLQASLDSVINSSYKPTEIIIVEDGPLTNELYDVLDRYTMLKRIKLNKNMGLGVALNKGIEMVQTDLIARMDTDDICDVNRFKIQISRFMSNPKLILIGSNVSEFEDNPLKICQIKKMPITGKEIKKHSKLRNPFNHPTVMFKKSAIQKSGFYQHMPFFEDYYLWLRMLKIFPEDSFENIDKSLVLMRTNEDLYSRRGGFSYVVDNFRFRKNCVKENLLEIKYASIATCISIVVSIVPNKIRKKIYINHLRNKKR